MAIAPPLSASGTTRPRARRPRLVRSTTGRPATDSNTSTVSSPAKRRNGNRASYRNTTLVEPPKTPAEGYHLSEDLADDAIDWLRKHRAFSPDKPFFMYWATGAVHGPHHVAKEWADKYKGRFDDGWDAYRERVFVQAKEKGWIPAEAQLTPRHPTMTAWESIPENERPFQRRLMEVFAGFGEHADVQAGRVLDEIDNLGYGDNTLVFYIWGDNGSSAEGQNGTISELLAQNSIPTTVRAADQSAGRTWRFRRTGFA